MTGANKIVEKYDVVVVGGGMAGICAAIAAARHGARTALVHNRPVLGGNASSEVRMHICGANCHGRLPDARETGILEEILLENRKRNIGHSFSVFDTILWEKVKFQEGLHLYLNTQMTAATVEGATVKSISAMQITTEKVFEFTADIFVDCTGDGYLAYAAGADYTVGREGRSEYNEQFAPETGDRKTMGNTLMFKARNTGSPVEFQKPFWAYSFAEEDLIHRPHGTGAAFGESSEIDSGYWWIELGGEADTIADGEEIRDELMKSVYGIWDHIKNGGDHRAENYVLDWVQFLPGKRESRRILGDYVLREQDLLEEKIFQDAVAFGGWPMDMHPPEGLRYKGEPTNFINLQDLYSIPYRCYYSRNIANLMMAGRNISATHMAFGSTRIMGTCAIGGQAVGTAAAMAVKYQCRPSGIQEHMEELQQLLLKDDCYVPGAMNRDSRDKAREGKVSVSSRQEGCEGQNVVNGVPRRRKGNNNCWVSDGLSEKGEWLCIDLGQKQEISEVHLKFDSNLSNSMMLSLSEITMAGQVPGLPRELVRDYTLEIMDGERVMAEVALEDNYQRFVKHKFDERIYGDKVRIRVYATWGDANARIFEMRAY